MFGIIIKINPKSKMREDFRFITRFSWKLEGFIFTDVLTNCSWLFPQLPWEPVQIHTFPHKSKEKMVIFAEKYCAGYLRDQNHYRPKQACKRAITIICLADLSVIRWSFFFLADRLFEKIWNSRIFEKILDFRFYDQLKSTLVCGKIWCRAYLFWT